MEMVDAVGSFTLNECIVRGWDGVGTEERGDFIYSRIMAAQIAAMNTMAIVPNIANLFVAWREDFIVWITSFGWFVFNFFCAGH